MSIDKPDAILTIPISPPHTGRPYTHGDSRMMMINSRSLVFTKVLPPHPSAQYRIPTGTCIGSIQSPKTNHQENIKILRK